MVCWIPVNASTALIHCLTSLFGDIDSTSSLTTDNAICLIDASQPWPRITKKKKQHLAIGLHSTSVSIIFKNTTKIMMMLETSKHVPLNSKLKIIAENYHNKECLPIEKWEITKKQANNTREKYSVSQFLSSAESFLVQIVNHLMANHNWRTMHHEPIKI